MDPVSALGLTASIIACIQLAQALSKNFGLSEHSRADLERMLKTLRGFLAAYEGLKSIAALDESKGRFLLVEQTVKPWNECQEVIDEVHKRLKEKNLFDRWVRGSHWDRKINKCLSTFEDIREQFNIAIQSDKLQIIAAVEKQSRQVVCDTRDIKENQRGLKEYIRDLKDYARNIKQDTQAIKGDTRDVREVTRDIRHSVAQQGSVLSEMKSGQAAEVQESRKQELYKWLATADPESSHDSARKYFEPGTGSWFLKSAKYNDWKKKNNSFLWLQGLPGCGKTILCSTIIEDMTNYCTQNADCFMAYYYFSFNDTEKQNANNLLRSMITRLLAQSDAEFNTILTIYERVKTTTPSLKTLKAMLKSIVTGGHGNIFLIVDAVDECPRDQEQHQRRAVCETLQEISSWGCEQLHLLITSRKETDIENIMNEIIDISTLFIQNDDVNADTRRYVKTQLEKDQKLRRWPTQIKTEIEMTLATGANGMFRWVFCQLDSLKRCHTPNQLRSALKSLPRSLHATYDRIISNIHEYDKIAIAALKWLVAFQKPTTIDQLAEALAMGLNSRAPFDVENRLANPYDILSILGSLVTVSRGDSEESNIQFAHFSVREYLTSGQTNIDWLPNFSELDVSQFALECCLNYIGSPIIREPRILNLMIWDSFLFYAFTWMQHARKLQRCHNNMEIAEYVIQYLGSWSWRENWCNAMNSMDDDESFFDNADNWSTALYCACVLNLTDVCKGLIDRHNMTASKPLQLGNYDPLDVASHFEDWVNVAFYMVRLDRHDMIRLGSRPPMSEIYVHFIRVLKLAAFKGDDHLLNLLVEFIKEATITMDTYHLDILTSFPKRADGRPYYTLLSDALFASDNEVSTICVRVKIGVEPDWPSKVDGVNGQRSISNIVAATIVMESSDVFRNMVNKILSYYLPFGDTCFTALDFITMWTLESKCDRDIKLAILLAVPENAGLEKQHVFSRSFGHAIREEDERLLKTLLELEMDPNAPFGHNYPLQFAVFRGWKAAVSILLDWNANVNNHNHWGYKYYFTTTDIEWIYCSPLEILKSGHGLCRKSEDDGLIEELLLSHGAIRARYEPKVLVERAECEGSE